MPKIITGVAADATADETPSMQVPVPGDLAAAAALELGQQQHLNATATNAARLNEAAALLQGGVPRVRQVASIAALKALDPGVYGVGSIVLVTGLTSAGGVTKGGGLFVLVNESMPETQVPGVPNAYLVVAPDAGMGRWLNVALSLGWSGGGFEPLVRRLQTKFTDVHGPGGSGHVVAVTGGADPVPSPVVVPVTGVLSGDAWEVEVNAIVASAFAGLIEVQLGVIVPPGTGDPIPAAGAVAIAQGNTVGTSVSLRYVQPVSFDGDYQVVLLVKCSTSGNVVIREDWQAVVRRHSTKL